MAAAVVSEESVAPTKVPCCQSRDCDTSGTVVLRRPPNMMAEIGTPFGSSYSGASVGHWVIGVQNRLLGCAALTSDPGVHGWPCQSVSSGGASSVMSSHHTPPSGVRATLVKTELPFSMVCIAIGLVRLLVPGATPKRPYSGFTAYSRPSLPKVIQAISSPMVSTL